MITGADFAIFLEIQKYLKTKQIEYICRQRRLSDEKEIRIRL